MDKESPDFALFVGIDWSDSHHDICIIDRQGNVQHEQIEHSAETIDEWVSRTLVKSGGEQVAIIVEQARGALVHALMAREGLTIFPVNPKQFAKYRESYGNSGAKSDPSDARMLALMLRERHQLLHPWVPDDEETRLLARLCQTRRQLVNNQTRLWQQLVAHLKTFFPLALELASGKKASPLLLEIVRRWGDPRSFRRLHPGTLRSLLTKHGVRDPQKLDDLVQRIRSAKLLTTDAAVIEPAQILCRVLGRQLEAFQKPITELDARIAKAMAEHPDAELFTALPGAGQAIAPRLLTAFGSDRDRYACADEVATFSGIAPVTRQSGRSRVVLRRTACPKFLLQTFHEHAAQAIRWCPWSRAYYDLLKSRKMKHHAALRKLAGKWIRIMYRVWKTRTPYDPDRYLNNLRLKNPEIIPFLKNSPSTP